MTRRALALLVVLSVVVGGVPAAADEPEVTARGAVLWDAADDRVLWGHNEREGLPPASTTKIMTVLLALEAGAVDETVTVSAEAVETGRRPGAATLGLTEGQQIPMRSLLAGLMLRSGNDAAVAVAEHVAGSEAAFVEKMNARAGELGMDATNFLNASGLTDDPDHRASALDLARLADLAMADDDFAEWAGAPAMDVPGLGRLESRNELLSRYDGATGVKTGYTNVAGLCLVGSARRGARPLIAVVLGSTGGLGAGTSFTDTIAVLEHGYDDWRRPRPVRRSRPVVPYRWADAAVRLTPDDTLARTVAADESAVWRVRLSPVAPRPVEQGAPLGVAELLVEGAVIDTTPLRA
ncbi:MAG TPA: serine hydrolase, partial [Egibacteraceae bacterium]|nr:serine hydrolase [Egibacteraceae bacterium]